MPKPKPVKKLQRPALWWREPLSTFRLRGLTDDEAANAIAAERYARVSYLQDAIRELRTVTKGFESRDGYPLDSKKLVRISKKQYEKIRRDIVMLRDVRSRPHLEIHPRSARQRRSTVQKTGEVFKGQKRFFFHEVSGKNVSYKFVDGNLQIEFDVKGGNTFTRYYFFTKKPGSWAEVVTFTKKLMNTGMRHGFYRMYNSIYGEIGESVEIGQLLHVLETVFVTYNRWLSGTILGWVWMGDTLHSAIRRGKQQSSIRERYRETQKARKQKRSKLIKKRLSK
jgi:hypothetical protein